MTASKLAKERGLKSLSIIVTEAGETNGKPNASRQNLHNWYLYKRGLFDLLIDGCLYRQQQKEKGND